jgi:hypothetical protein
MNIITIHTSRFGHVERDGIRAFLAECDNNKFETITTNIGYDVIMRRWLLWNLDRKPEIEESERVEQIMRQVDQEMKQPKGLEDGQIVE